MGSRGIGWARDVKTSGEAQMIKKIIGEINQPIIFDVGGNIGEWSLEILKANRKSFVHIFEPSNFHIQYLKNQLNNFESRILIVPYGLSNKNAKEILYKDRDITGMASLLKRDLAHIGINFDRQEEVNLIVGDEYIVSNSISRVDLIKIDVEGHEFKVIKGFEKSIKRKIIKMIQFEFGHTHIESCTNFRDFFYFFNSCDWKLGILMPNGNIWFPDKYLEIFENYFASNFIAIPK